MGKGTRTPDLQSHNLAREATTAPPESALAVPGEPIPGGVASKPSEERGAERGVSAPFEGPGSDPELARLLAVWSALPPTVRRALADLAEGQAGGRP